MSIRDVICEHRLIVCVGSGGVGKTTTAAAIAVQGALAGRRAMVLTIDPARRLAQALGLETLASGAERIAEDSLRAIASDGDSLGELSAGMLDQKSAWDEFIARHAPNDETRDTILANEFYQHLSQSFAGSAEYMAIEELCRIDESNRYDLIVLDTPPTRHALDFLEAPRRLEDFLDSSVLGWFVKPYASMGWSAWKTASRSARFLFERIEEATGVQALAQISDFFIAMEQLFDGINARGQRVRALLSGASTAFLLVAGPDEQILGESEEFAARMTDLGMPLKGVVMNRVHSAVATDGPHLAEADVLAAGVSKPVASWLVKTHEDARRTAAAEELRREAFESGLPADVAFVAVPELDHDVHELADLAAISQLLGGS